MTLHVVALPFESSPACAYTGKVKRFLPMMRALGHEVVVYGPEHYGGVACGGEGPREFTIGAPHWNALNNEAVAAIAERMDVTTDFLCIIAGLAQQPIMDALPQLIPVEFGVGYGGVIPQAHHVFESYSWQAAVMGALSGGNAHGIDGRFYDAVIPNYFDVSQFPEGKGDGGYYLFVGRLIDRKGPHIAAEVCERLGVPLILAGEGEWHGYGEHVGVVGPEERARLMGAAVATFVPTQYWEPFGGVACESMTCGTPVITTPWGAFTETVRQGVDGYRCHTLAEFMAAADDVYDLRRRVIREDAIARWSTESVGPMYARHFERLAMLRGAGWYSLPARSHAVT